MDANVFVKFGWHPMKAVAEVAFWISSQIWGPLLTKFQSALKILIFGRSRQK